VKGRPGTTIYRAPIIKKRPVYDCTEVINECRLVLALLEAIAITAPKFVEIKSASMADADHRWAGIGG